MWRNRRYEESASVINCAMAVVWRKSTFVMKLWLNQPLFMECHFCYKEQLMEKPWLNTWILGRYFLKNEMSLSLLGLTIHIVANDDIEWNLEFWKTSFCWCKLDSVPKLKYCSAEIDGDTSQWDLLILYKMFQHL